MVTTACFIALTCVTINQKTNKIIEYPCSVNTANVKEFVVDQWSEMKGYVVIAKFSFVKESFDDVVKKLNACKVK